MTVRDRIPGCAVLEGTLSKTQTRPVKFLPGTTPRDPANRSQFGGEVRRPVSQEGGQARVTEVLKLGAETYEGELKMDYLSRLSPRR
jgi:hypothetical protein